MTKSRILFRADGNTRIGLGHVVRSLALAEMLQPDFICEFAIQQPDHLIKQQILKVCSKIIELPHVLPDSADFNKELTPFLQGNELVVLDGYNFNSTYHQEIKNQGSGLIIIDDIFTSPLVADLIINHGTLEEDKYSLKKETKLLVGPAYRLLRAPFRQRNPNKNIQADNNIFLCFGGSDYQNLTSIYLERILQNDKVKAVHVTIGSVYPHLPHLEKVLTKYATKKVILHQNIDASAMADVMKKCRVAIVPGSSVSLECCSIGLPALCGFYADNQKSILDMLTQTGMVINIGNFNNLTNEAFQTYLNLMLDQAAAGFLQNQQHYFKQDPGSILNAEFKDLAAKLFPEITARKASETDYLTYFDWANDPATRAFAINTEEILLDNHINWFKAKLQSENTFMYIFFADNTPIGQVRFDLEEDGYWIDYSVAKEMRGQKLGAVLVQKAIACLAAECPEKELTINALVQVENIPSRRVFNRLGFLETGSREYKSRVFVLFTKN